jgi:surface polysaccharide O-acyltransferase-like enzyme
MWHRDHGVLNHQEYVMELVIVTLSIGTLILLATHSIDYALESTLRQSSRRHTPDHDSGELPLPFEGAVQ